MYSGPEAVDQRSVPGDLRSANSAHPIRLSACLIVRNEEKRLPDCLASVEFCDEIVVVDSGSTDRTLEVARAAGATVLEHPWEGFARQRNMALDAAHGVWALEVDADERITPQLRDEILTLVADPPPETDNAVIPLRQVFLGARLGPSALYPAGRTRLFRRDRYRHDDRRTVHEGLWPAGRSAYPNGDLEHILAESLRESVHDLRAYSQLESAQLPDAGPTHAVLIGMVARPVMKFLYRAWLLGGWKDGLPGITKILLDCVYDSLTWARYLRYGGQRTAGDASAEDADQREDGADGGGGRHFGRVFGYCGPVRIVAVASGRRPSEAAANWLERAARDGADVALITNAPPAWANVRTATIGRAGPITVLRALAREDQRNPIEVLVPPTALARAATRLLPRHLRGRTPPPSLLADPRGVIQSALAQRPDRRQAQPAGMREEPVSPGG